MRFRFRLELSGEFVRTCLSFVAKGLARMADNFAGPTLAAPLLLRLVRGGCDNRSTASAFFLHVINLFESTYTRARIPVVFGVCKLFGGPTASTIIQ